MKFLHGKEAKEVKVKLERARWVSAASGDFEEHFPKLFERFKEELSSD